jgi:hypothetical protein
MLGPAHSLPRSAANIDDITFGIELPDGQIRVLRFREFTDMPWSEFHKKLSSATTSWTDILELLETLETVAMDITGVHILKSKILSFQDLDSSDRQLFVDLAWKYNLDYLSIQQILSKPEISPTYHGFLLRSVKAIMKRQAHIIYLYIKSRVWLAENDYIKENPAKRDAFKSLYQILRCQQEPSENRVQACLDRM